MNLAKIFSVRKYNCNEEEKLQQMKYNPSLKFKVLVPLVNEGFLISDLIKKREIVVQMASAVTYHHNTLQQYDTQSACKRK